jgi:hypothetical protein
MQPLCLQPILKVKPKKSATKNVALKITTKRGNVELRCNSACKYILIFWMFCQVKSVTSGKIVEFENLFETLISQ